MYRIAIDSQNPELLEKYISDMYQLTPQNKALKYIALHNKWCDLKDIVIQQHSDVYQYVCEKHPNMVIEFEGRIKSLASTLEKSYMKTEKALQHGTFNPKHPPILYDGIACRMIVKEVTYQISQSGRFFSEKNMKPYYAFRTKNNTLLKINIGDYIDIGNNKIIEIKEDNLICNPDGSLSIRNNNGDTFALNNRTIQKTDHITLERACYDMNNTLIDYLQKQGYICVPERTKDFIKHPKHNMNLENIRNITKNNNNKVRYMNTSKRAIERLRYLKEHKDRINYQRKKRLSQYRSLHYGAYDPEYHYYFEYQIRDVYMHHIAEHDKHVGHDTYKKLPIDRSAPDRVPIAFTCKKFLRDQKYVFESTFYDESYMYKKIFKKSKEEVLREVAKLEVAADLNQCELPTSSEDKEPEGH